MTFTMLGLSQEAFAKPLAAIAPSLGAAGSFSVLAATSAASAGMTTLQGDLGLSTNDASSITGDWDVNGGIYTTPSSLAFTANADALGAYNNLAGQTSSGAFGDPAPLPGVWTSPDSATYTGTLTLNGTYDDVWVFQIPTSLTFSGNVVMGGDAQACHVFWAVGVDTTIAVGSHFIGTLIGHRDITLLTNATVSGRIISLDRDIVVDSNTISMPPCASAPVEGGEITPTGYEAGSTTPVPTVSGLPTSGGAPLRNEVLPLGLALLFGGLSIVVSVLIVRSLRRDYRLKK